MLEAQPLHRVVQFDVDAEVVGIELEFVAIEQPAGLIDVHDQIGDVAVVLEAPMAVTPGLGLEIDGLHVQIGASSNRFGAHLPVCIIFHPTSTAAAAAQQQNLVERPQVPQSVGTHAAYLNKTRFL